MMKKAVLGAAILAGVGAGVYRDVPSACDAILRESEPLLPDAERHAAYEPYFDLYQKLYPALKESFHTLAGLS